MPPYAALLGLARARHLDIFGAFHTTPEDDVPDGTETLILLGPLEPDFWPHFTQSEEYCDGRADPVDRWSSRTIGELARGLGGKALFPFGGPPHLPFYRWALRSGRAWASPVQLLVQDTAGLLVSYRGAIALDQRIDLPPTPTRPCDSCIDRPCLSACPAAALSYAKYDVAACHAHLDGAEGSDCMLSGCAARRACPASKDYARLPEHSAYHMRLFHT
jgi:hypothetical protein